MLKTGKRGFLVMLLAGVGILAGCDPYYGQKIAFEGNVDWENRQVLDQVVRESVIAVIPNAVVEKVEVDHKPVFLVKVGAVTALGISVVRHDTGCEVSTLSRVKNQDAGEILTRIENKLKQANDGKK